MRPRIEPACLILSILLLAPAFCAAAEEEPKLLGRCGAGRLGEPPYAEWFDGGYGDYQPNPEILARLRQIDRKGVTIEVFFGTWCGDSRREVPRLLKLLDLLEWPEHQRELVAVDNEEGSHKTSPSGEERGREVYRVPTVVVSRDGHEVARLVEHPVESLERDLLAILSGQPYQPSYESYPVVRRWLQDGLLADPNVSPAGLAAQVRRQVGSEGELSAAGRVLLSRGDTREAVMLFRINCDLYPQSSAAFARLADGLLRLGDPAGARETAEKALRLNTDPERVKDLVELIERTSAR